MNRLITIVAVDKRVIIYLGCPIDENQWLEKQLINWYQLLKLVNWYHLESVNQWLIDSHTKAVHWLLLIRKTWRNLTQWGYVTSEKVLYCSSSITNKTSPSASIPTILKLHLKLFWKILNFWSHLSIDDHQANPGSVKCSESAKQNNTSSYALPVCIQHLPHFFLVIITN